MIVSTENQKESTKKLLELISNYTKVAGYKVIKQNQLLPYLPAIIKWILKLKTQRHLH